MKRYRYTIRVAGKSVKCVTAFDGNRAFRQALTEWGAWETVSDAALNAKAPTREPLDGEIVVQYNAAQGYILALPQRALSTRPVYLNTLSLQMRQDYQRCGVPLNQIDGAFS